MRLSFGKTVAWVSAVTLLSTVVVFGQGGARGQRGGQQGGGTAQATQAGAALLQRACAGCHGAEVVTHYNYETPDGYRDIVNAMIGVGAQLTPQEVPVLVDYLFATYGKKPAAGAPAQTAAVTPDPGKAILEAACTTCHSLDSLASHIYDTKEPYEGLVRNMIGYGANVTDGQIAPLVDYMFKTYGKKPAAAAPSTASNATPAPSTPANDPGKAILDSACTTCHGLDGLKNHIYDSKGPYEGLVRSMIAYGANVTDAQIPPLVDYMFKTYGKK